MDSATPVALSCYATPYHTVDSVYTRRWTHGAIMRTGCGGYKYSIRCSNLSVDEVIPGLTRARYSSNGNKTWCRAKVGNVDGQPCEYAGFECMRRCICTHKSAQLDIRKWRPAGWRHSSSSLRV